MGENRFEEDQCHGMWEVGGDRESSWQVGIESQVWTGENGGREEEKR